VRVPVSVKFTFITGLANWKQNIDEDASDASELDIFDRQTYIVCDVSDAGVELNDNQIKELLDPDNYDTRDTDTLTCLKIVVKALKAEFNIQRQ
jgi:hypothetical protein